MEDTPEKWNVFDQPCSYGYSSVTDTGASIAAGLIYVCQTTNYQITLYIAIINNLNKSFCVSAVWHFITCIVSQSPEVGSCWCFRLLLTHQLLVVLYNEERMVYIWMNICLACHRFGKEVMFVLKMMRTSVWCDAFALGFKIIEYVFHSIFSILVIICKPLVDCKLLMNTEFVMCLPNYI